MSALIALIVGFAAMIIGFLGEGGHLGALISWTPAMIVFGGTLGSVLLSFPVEELKRTGGVLKVAFTAKSADLHQLIEYFHGLSLRTRKDGILSIESEAASGSDADPFIKKGIQLLVDGETFEMIEETLELEMDSIAQRHKAGAAIFDSAGGTAPTMGIVGTVLGLVHVLGGLADADMAELGHSISSAFLATLYGLSSANLIFLPLGSRLKSIAKKEQMEKELILEAVLLLKENVKPSLLTERLNGFLNGEEVLHEPAVAHGSRVAAEA